MMPTVGNSTDNQVSDSSRKSSTQKRIEARKVRDEQKKAARDEAAAKKAKNGKPDKKDAAKAKKAKGDLAKKKAD